MKTDDIQILPEVLLIERRAEFEEAMAQNFAGSPEAVPSVQDRQAVRDIYELLIAVLNGKDGISAVESPDAFSATYYSRFGDALSPILRDVLGDSASQSFVAKAVDCFWGAVRAVRSR
ncbi:hypothetical protein KRR38_31825 [Novosphingobium sp. G106]|uniref:hypothetical protein n=1 Tax=Novosphingobium sp. G106 TaxID=2849500 RepID=UPI001C2CE165|nr:hypothetical protein [Novosphingobium sp. G106]MBV1692135.1 hypothetical protein [Novosphingobium sp. G106]